MQFEVDIIKSLQTLSNSFTDGFNQFLSFFGTETLFLIIAVVMYWCIDKKFAYRLFNVYILGVAATNLLKIGFKRTRPFNAYPEEVRSIGDPESSYSFPSGHTQSVSSTAAILTIKYGKRYYFVPIVGAVLTVLVMLSRMYLGQHYLSDVFAGLTVGVFFSIFFNFLLSFLGDREEWFVIGAVIITVAVLGVVAGLGLYTTAADLLKGVGAFLAFDIGYFVEKRYVRYDIRANKKWWAYAIRLALGLGVTVGIQQLFKLFLPESLPMLYCFLRYCIMAIWAALAAPALFKVMKI